MSKRQFKSVKVFMISAVGYDPSTNNCLPKEGNARLNHTVKRLKDLEFFPQCMCVPRSEEVAATGWELLSKLDRTKKGFPCGEFSELKRPNTQNWGKFKTVSQVLEASAQARNGRSDLTKLLQRIAQYAVLHPQRLSRKDPIEHDILVVSESEWLELTCPEPERTPIRIGGGNGFIYTIQTSWVQREDEACEVSARIVDYEPIAAL